MAKDGELIIVTERTKERLLHALKHIKQLCVNTGQYRQIRKRNENIIHMKSKDSGIKLIVDNGRYARFNENSEEYETGSIEIRKTDADEPYIHYIPDK